MVPLFLHPFSACYNNNLSYLFVGWLMVKIKFAKRVVLFYSTLSWAPLYGAYSGAHDRVELHFYIYIAC